jgi:hypothetical protein
MKMARSIPKPGRNTHSTAAPNAPSYATRERVSVQKISNNGGNALVKRILFFAYGSPSYLIFVGTLLYAVCFVGAFAVPRTLDGAASEPPGLSLAIDSGPPALFAAQHSVMARKWFKD